MHNIICKYEISVLVDFNLVAVEADHQAANFQLYGRHNIIKETVVSMNGWVNVLHVCTHSAQVIHDIVYTLYAYVLITMVCHLSNLCYPVSPVPCKDSVAVTI